MSPEAITEESVRGIISQVSPFIKGFNDMAPEVQRIVLRDKIARELSLPFSNGPTGPHADSQNRRVAEIEAQLAQIIQSTP